MLNRFAPVLTLAAWLAASAALAQHEPLMLGLPKIPTKPAASASAPASTDASDSTVVSGIVVQGQARMTTKAFLNAVEKFVHIQGRPSPMIGQISRWRYPVCPMTAGMAPSYNAFVSARIKDVAQRVSVPAGACRGVNILVVFSAKPDLVMADVRDHHAFFLGYHRRSEAASLARFEPPIKTWYVTVTRGLFDEYLAIDAPDIEQPHEYAVPGGFATRIRNPLTNEFGFALVVVDSKQLVGRAIGPVADEIAMMTLSNPAPREGCSPLPSVMDALDPTCVSNPPIEGLTVYDEAYLKGLYAYQGGEIRVFESVSIAKTVASIGPDGKVSGAGDGLQAGFLSSPSEVVEPVNDDSPSPATEAFVRRWVESMAAGAPDYKGMAPALARLASSQERGALALFKSWGALRSVRFDGVTPDYQDRYIATFEKAEIPVVISPIGPDGKVSGLRFTPPARGQASPPQVAP